MKISTTSERLRYLMNERHLRQVDILNLCEPHCKKYNVKMGRNDLSQYVSGKVEPGQEKLTILGIALSVSEAWLMGYDVPMNRMPNTISELSQDEKSVVYSYRKSDDITKTMVRRLLKIEDTTEPLLVAAHTRTDVEVTDEGIQHDLDLMNDDENWK
jgi:transcriptional regulator with XRE-family HTH domain